MKVRVPVSVKVKFRVKGQMNGEVVVRLGSARARRSTSLRVQQMVKQRSISTNYKQSKCFSFTNLKTTNYKHARK